MNRRSHTLIRGKLSEVCTRTIQIRDLLRQSNHSLDDHDPVTADLKELMQMDADLESLIVVFQSRKLELEEICSNYSVLFKRTRVKLRKQQVYNKSLLHILKKVNNNLIPYLAVCVNLIFVMIR